MQMQLSYTAHAQVRSRQRGVRADVAEFVYLYADRERDVGRGCLELSVSRKALRRLVEDGSCRTPMADKAASVRLIVAGAQLVTTYHA